MSQVGGKECAMNVHVGQFFISLVENGNFPIEFVSKCAKARFKIGRMSFPGHAYDMVISGSPTEDLRSDVRRIFAGMTEFLEKVR